MGLRRHANALQRAEDDIARGDLGLARQRLGSFLRHRGYDPELLARLGRLCHDMHDLHQAGRYWLLSTDDSPEARTAIEEFVQRSASDPRHVVGQLPHAAFQSRVTAYPPVVVERLRRFGLDAVWRRSPVPRAAPKRLKDRFAFVGCASLFLGFMFVFIVGMRQVILWIVGK